MIGYLGDINTLQDVNKYILDSIANYDTKKNLAIDEEGKKSGLSAEKIQKAKDSYGAFSANVQAAWGAILTFYQGKITEPALANQPKEYFLKKFFEKLENEKFDSGIIKGMFPEYANMVGGGVSLTTILMVVGIGALLYYFFLKD